VRCYAEGMVVDMKPSRGQRNSRLRRLVMSTFDAVSLGGVLADLSYRLGLHGKLTVTVHELQLAVGQPLQRPLVLAFASDLHAGPITHPLIFAKLVEEIVRRSPDVLLLGGDYVSRKAEQVEALTACLAQCNPPLGKFGVLGNHDLWTDDAHIVQRLAAAGVQMLINRNCALPAPFDSVSICGIDDPWTGNADIAQAFRGAGPIRIFLSHSPDGLLLLGNERFDVGFAGHTHGGQIALPDGTPIVGAGGPLSRAYGRGLFDVAGSGPLVVSRGIGCSNIPVRINSDPELVICTLYPP
jgi:uncharacterized protein